MFSLANQYTERAKKKRAPNAELAGPQTEKLGENDLKGWAYLAGTPNEGETKKGRKDWNSAWN
eukprot:JP438611.1.p3 GENE.JP438611.1~~JP438611.1.p3  ORF type:complete len:63 (+),score=23.62 JP438611.1:118-306(+)